MQFNAGKLTLLQKKINKMANYDQLDGVEDKDDLFPAVCNREERIKKEDLYPTY